MVKGDNLRLMRINIWGVAMEILDDLLSILNPEAGVRDIRQGLFHTGVLTRNCGLAATLPRDALQQTRPSVKEPGFLLEKTALELPKWQIGYRG